MSGKLKSADLLALPKSEQDEINRKQKRLAAFINKLNNGSPFSLATGGGSVVLEASPKDMSDLATMLGRNTPSMIDRDKLTNMKFTKKGGKEKYGLSNLEKTPEFGGKAAGEGAGVVAERQAHQSLVKQLGQIMEETGNDYVKVLIPGLNGNKPYKITHAVWTDEALAGSTEKKTKPKSDLELWYEQTPVVFISYKDNYGRRKNKNGTKTVGYADPRGFQQFGGMSEGGSPEINKFPEVQNFLKYFEIMREEHGKKSGRWLKKNHICKISSEELKKKSVYGLNWQAGTGFSRQNCSVVLQGRVAFTELENDVYELTANHVQINSRNSDDGMTGIYEPVMFVRWNPSRGGAASARYIIMPEGGSHPYDEITKKQIEDKIKAYDAKKAAEAKSAKQTKTLQTKISKVLKKK